MAEDPRGLPSPLLSSSLVLSRQLLVLPFALPALSLKVATGCEQCIDISIN